MNKRGMSQIVTTVILVVLVLVAIAIVWGVVSNLIGESADDVNLEQFTIDLDAQSAYVSGNDVVVKVKRNAGEGELVKVKFVVTNGTSSEVFEQEVTLEELEEETYSFTPSTSMLGSIETISVTPIYSSSSGQETLGGVSDEIDIGSGGDGLPGGGEECDGGAQGGDEECDGDDLGAYTSDCSTHPDFSGGTLSCTGSCTFNTDLCTGGSCTPDGSTQDCSLQDGVCAGAQKTCTLGVWPVCDTAIYLVNNNSYEATEANCTDGYDNDCNGLTDNEEDSCELTWEGTAIDPWPSATKILFVINETDDEFINPIFDNPGVNMFIDFSSGAETRCIRIYDYIFPYEEPLFDNAIVRLNDNPVGDLPINIVTGDNFTIYEKSECGA